MLFVRGCRLLCRRHITEPGIREMERFFHAFVTKFESLYGDVTTTPNIHSLLHLGRLVRLFGPACNWWCFASERLNGILKRVFNNHHYIELQVFRALDQEAKLLSMAANHGFGSTLEPLYREVAASVEEEEEQTMQRFSPETLRQHSSFVQTSQAAKGNEPFPGQLGTLKEDLLNSDEHAVLLRALASYYGNPDSSVRASPRVRSTSSLELCGSSYGVTDSRNVRSSFIYSRFTDSEGGDVCR